jgi:hypothetical protein
MEKVEKFYQLRGEKVMVTFKLNEVKTCQNLEALLSKSDDVLSDYENMTLDLALQRYETLGRGWNEEELKMHFISPIIAVANPNIDSVCKTFFERPLTGIINDYELHVVTDCMVASYNSAGQPLSPYFFLQEFKQSQRFGRTDRSGGRPEGQMLAAMLLAQQINQDGKTIYGCYVIERNWFFTTLNGLDYCVSKQFDASDKTDLLAIVYALRHLKDLILNR